ncbi:unnamed protein product [Miscanthus lutarioriparius]|uniref:Uncharacterized protein n=1 Tax=Miscanthus lutarioriparius TaxID=422564 RepID=A0A811R1B0_9POAL|nr:unnamed protein product [Miscanthus lutarioriparius]
MAGSARSSAAAKHAYLMFAPSRGSAATTRGPGAGTAEEFDESDVVWGSFGGGADSHSSPGAELQAAAGWARPVPTSRAGAGRKKPAVDGGGAAGSLPMNIPDWQKILGVEYRDHYHAGEWEPDADDDDGSYGGRARGGGGGRRWCRRTSWRGAAGRRRCRCTRGSAGRSRAATSAGSGTPSGRRPASRRTELIGDPPPPRAFGGR